MALFMIFKVSYQHNWNA